MDIRRVVALAAPIAVPAAMTATFQIAQRRLGDRRGYIAGFAAYWATCAALSAIALGPSRLPGALARRAARPTNLDVALLAWPVLGAVSTRLVPELRGANRQMIATSAAVAELNAPLEELLWRASYLELWPDNAWLGVIWPTVGFALWHMAPQVIHPSRLGTGRYVGASFALGLSWAWVAWRSHSVRWTTLSHVMNRRVRSTERALLSRVARIGWARPAKHHRRAAR